MADVPREEAGDLVCHFRRRRGGIDEDVEMERVRNCAGAYDLEMLGASFLISARKGVPKIMMRANWYKTTFI